MYFTSFIRNSISAVLEELYLSHGYPSFHFVVLKTVARNKHVLKKLSGPISVQFVFAADSDISLIWLFTAIGSAFQIEIQILCFN